MNRIIGSEVINVKSEIGTIENVSKEYVCAHFKNEGRTIKFQYPQCFIGERPFLMAKSETVQNMIAQDIKTNYSCDICGEYSSMLNQLSDMKVCASCAKRMIQCSCGKYYDSRTTELSKKKLCKDCFDKRYFKCSTCQDYTLRTHLCNSDFVPPNEPICNLCAEKKGLCKCFVCQKSYPIEMIEEIEHKCICDTCAADIVKQCEHCGKKYINNTNNNKGLCKKCNDIVVYRERMERVKWNELRIKKIKTSDIKYYNTQKLMTQLSRRSPFEDENFELLLLEYWEGGLMVVGCLNNDKWFPDIMKSVFKNSYTMTDIKHKGYWATIVFDSDLDKSATLIAQYKDDMHIFLFEQPIKLRAMTDFDTDYRKEYYYGQLVYEGNNYGDTTDFYIIGKLKQKE